MNFDLKFCFYWYFLEFLAAYLFATSFCHFFFLFRPTQKALSLSFSLSVSLCLSLLSLSHCLSPSLSPVSSVNIYIIISKFLHDKSPEINVLFISHSSMNYAFLAVPCLYYVICHSRPAIRDYHQSRRFFNYMSNEAF